jgi:hypothetical protein
MAFVNNPFEYAYLGMVGGVGWVAFLLNLDPTIQPELLIPPCMIIGGIVGVMVWGCLHPEKLKLKRN